METLPCGCKISLAGTDPFVIEPCSTSCEMYLYAIEEGKRQGKPIEVRSI